MRSRIDLLGGDFHLRGNGYRLEEIKAQRAVVSRLKREIFGIDKTYKSKYIRDFLSDYRDFRKTCSIDEVIGRASKSDVVYFGDYHPLEASQDLALRFMRELPARGRKVVLAVEMLYEHQQAFLDNWMKGKIDEGEFLRLIDYRSEWGFSWESYKRLFLQAKDPFIPIFGIDSEPREHLRYIRNRDNIAARKIANIMQFFPGHLVLVMIGESHLAENHLPAVVRRLVPEVRDVIVVQNIDELYWELLSRGKEDAEAVRVASNRYCAFTASPLVKYQSYREVLDQWIEGDSVDKYTPMMSEMVETILYFLADGRKRLDVTLDNGLKEPVLDLFPEMVCRSTYSSFNSFLRRKKISAHGLIVARENLKCSGISYIPETNNFLIVKFDPFHAAKEAARFVVYVLRNGVGRKRRRIEGESERFYAYALEEAVAHVGSRIVNPTGQYPIENTLLSVFDRRNVTVRPFGGMGLRETRALAEQLRYHLQREKNSTGSLMKTRRLRKIYGLGIKRRVHIIKSLGLILGETIFNDFRRGRFDRKDIVDLFRFDSTEDSAAESKYMDLSKRTKSFDYFGEIVGS